MSKFELVIYWYIRSEETICSTWVFISKPTLRTQLVVAVLTKTYECGSRRVGPSWFWLHHEIPNVWIIVPSAIATLEFLEVLVTDPINITRFFKVSVTELIIITFFKVRIIAPNVTLYGLSV